MLSLQILWRNRQLGLLVLLIVAVLLLWGKQQQVERLQAALEARPKVVDRLAKTTTEGPSKVTTRTFRRPRPRPLAAPARPPTDTSVAELPWGADWQHPDPQLDSDIPWEVMEERVEERGERRVELSRDRRETPVGPPRPAGRWLAGATLSPGTALRDLTIIHAGYSINNRLDLMWSYGAAGVERRHMVTTVIRF